MKNEEKFKTAEERVTAFRKMRKPFVGNCRTACKLTESDKFGGFNTFECFANWLSLEAEEEKPEPCPFCGNTCSVCASTHYENRIVCNNLECGYHSQAFPKESDADLIAAHNRVARAVRLWTAEKGNHEGK